MLQCFGLVIIFHRITRILLLNNFFVRKINFNFQRLFTKNRQLFNGRMLNCASKLHSWCHRLCYCLSDDFMC